MEGKKVIKQFRVPFEPNYIPQGDEEQVFRHAMAVKIPRGVTTKVMVAMIGTPAEAARAARTASSASRRSIMVSTQITSAPASTNGPTWRAKDSDTSSGSVSP